MATFDQNYDTAIENESYKYLERTVARGEYKKDLSQFILRLCLDPTVGEYLQSWSNDINSRAKMNNLDLSCVLLMCKYNERLTEIVAQYVKTDILKSSGLGPWIRPELLGYHKYLKPEVKHNWSSFKKN